MAQIFLKRPTSSAGKTGSPITAASPFICVVSLFSLMPKFCENASAIFNTFVRPNRSASGIKQLVSGNGGP